LEGLVARVVGAVVRVGESRASSSSSYSQSSSSYTLPSAEQFLRILEAARDPVRDVGRDPDLEPGRLGPCVDWRELGRESLLTTMAGAFTLDTAAALPASCCGCLGSCSAAPCSSVS